MWVELFGPRAVPPRLGPISRLRNICLTPGRWRVKLIPAWHIFRTVHAGGARNGPGPMTLSKCLNCGLEQDFEGSVGYCEGCGKKLPIPHIRGKDSARKQFLAERRTAEVGASNAFVTVLLALGGLAGIGTIVFLIVRSQM